MISAHFVAAVSVAAALVVAPAPSVSVDAHVSTLTAPAIVVPAQVLVGQVYAGFQRAASEEAVRAEQLATASAGKVDSATLASLQRQAQRVQFLGAYQVDPMKDVYQLRELEKSVSEQARAFEAAQQAALAAQRAAAERAQAAASAAAAVSAAAEASAQSYADVSTSASSAATTSSARTLTAAPAAQPYYAPGVSHERPANDDCGPCPGATLVLTKWGYWGCP